MYLSALEVGRRQQGSWGHRSQQVLQAICKTVVNSRLEYIDLFRAEGFFYREVKAGSSRTEMSFKNLNCSAGLN